MPISLVELDSGVTKAIVTGRIDIAGAQEIDLPMNVLGGSRKAVVVDLSGVDFMASMGLRSLVSCAKVVLRRGGKIAIVAPRPAVLDVITTMGVDELIPVYQFEAEAVAAVR